MVLDPVAINGPILTIRRFPPKPITMEQLLAMGALTGECRDQLKELVKAGCNILVSGGTGSGKTTFLNVLSGFIPQTERVITIEDSAELQIRNIPNLVSLETRNANVEGCKENYHQGSDKGISADEAGSDHRGRGEGKGSGGYAAKRQCGTQRHDNGTCKQCPGCGQSSGNHGAYGDGYASFGNT